MGLWSYKKHVAVVLAVMCVASGCGASDKPTKELLRTDIRGANLYVQIKGPAGAVSKVAKAIEEGAFTKIKTGPVPRYGEGGSFLPPLVRSRPVCLFARTIQSFDDQSLQPWLGKKITFTMYGKKTSASALYCRLIAAGPVSAR